jgi:protein phosphatase
MSCGDFCGQGLGDYPLKTSRNRFYISMHLLAHGLSDIGLKRSGNEDALLLGLLDADAPAPLPERVTFRGEVTAGGVLLVVSDGIGGCNAGEVASALAIATLHAKLRATLRDSGARTADLSAAFLAAIYATDQAVRADALLSPERTGMGATLTALWLRPEGAWLGQVGDSRLYRVRGAELSQLSPEHSPVGRMRLSGELTEEQARRHRYRNVIDQSLGGDPTLFMPEVLPVDIAAGDVLLLCSDGLTDGLADAALLPSLLGALNATLSPAEAAFALIEAAKQSSGRDNITAIVGKVS